MKHKIIILFFISLFTLLHASNIVEVDYGKIKIKKFNIGYILDKNNSTSVSTIKDAKFKTISNYLSLGNITDTLWLKVEIKNKTEIEKEIYLHNNFAYLSKEIIIYEFTDNKLNDQNIYNIFDDKEENKLTGSILVYPLKIQAKSTTSLYIKIIPTVTLTANLNIYDEKNHTKALINNSLFSNTIIIILLSLSLYNILLYFFNRKKEFIFYSLYLLNASIGLSYMYGTIFHNFEIYGESVYWINISAILVSGFLALFIKSIFNFKQKNKLLNTLLNSIIYIVIADFFIAIFIDLQLSINLVSFISLYSFIVIYYITFCLYKQQHPLTNTFITAYTIYIIGFSLSILALFGIIEINNFTFYASGVSLIIEALLFSYLIFYHIKLLEDKLINRQNILILKNQKAQMGDMIGAITHQWKQPLNTISSIVMLMQYKLKDGVEISPNHLNEKLTLMNDNTHFLNQTIDDFTNFFHLKKVKTDCDLSKLINKAISLSQDIAIAGEINIKYDLKFTKKIYLYENEFLHIILNIIQNSKEAFRDSEINDDSVKMIKIIGRTKDDATYIDIIDNAGGISKKNLPYIFNENYTTKVEKKGTGLGLYLSKVIIEDHMNGSIEVKNIGDGTMFRIVL